MGWRSFGKCLRKKVIPISVEAALHGPRVKSIVVQCGVDAVLDLLESSRVSHVIDARCVGEHLLVHFLCTQEGGDEIKLRDVRSYGIARVRAAEEQIWRDAAIAVSRPCVGRHS